MNKRAEIRQAIFERLSNTSLIPNTVNIFNQRYAPVLRLPAIIIFSRGDNSEETPAENFIKRRETITIEIYEKGRESHELVESGETPVIDKLQILIDAVEAELLNYRETLGGIVYLFTYRSTILKTDVNSGDVQAAAAMEFEAYYNDLLQ